MRHNYLNWLVPVASVTVAATILAVGIHDGVGPFLQFQWRWIGLGFIIAIFATATVLIITLRRFVIIRASLSWFTLLLSANICFLLLSLAEVLSANQEAAAFWQGLLPMSWIPIPVLLLFFVLTYINDSDMPLGLSAWTFTGASVAGLLFFAGFTGLIEHHGVLNARLEYWGYQSNPGPYSSIMYLWMTTLVIAGLVELVRAYRRSKNQIHRRQLRLFIFALSQYSAIALVFDVVLYSFNRDATPPMAFIYTTALSVIIGYGILRHGIFRVSPAQLSEPILRNLSEGILGLNPDYSVEFANVGARQIFGQDESAIRGSNLSAFFSSQDYQRLVAQGHDYARPAVFEDMVALGPAARRIPVTVTISQIPDDRGGLGGHILVVQNITELKQKTLQLAREKASVERRVRERTAQLHDERTKLQASIESLTVGFVLFDTKDRAIVQNAALSGMFGPAKPIQTLADLSERLGGAKLSDLCQDAHMAGRDGVSQEITAGGKIFRVFAVEVVSQESNDAILGTALVVDDITEVRVRERSRDEFFSIASHELRTPLTAIKGNTSIIMGYYKEALKDPDLNELVEDIHGSSVRLIEIVNDFLDLSRLEQGKLSFALAEHSLESIIETVAYEMKSILREKKLHLKVDTMTLGSLPKVWVDENRTKQVVYNLVGNAAKFTAKGGITIAAQVSGEAIEVTVTDTGRGIPLESRNLLFRKFQQAGHSLLTRDTTRGTGLGLYISRLIVERMGGEIGLKATTAGKGSTFYFTLPIATPAYRAAHPAAHASMGVDTGLTQPSPTQANPAEARSMIIR